MLFLCFQGSTANGGAISRSEKKREERILALRAAAESPCQAREWPSQLEGAAPKTHTHEEEEEDERGEGRLGGRAPLS